MSYFASRFHRLLLFALMTCGALVLSSSVRGQTTPARSATTRPPKAELVGAPSMRLTGEVDSNSPALRALIDGRQTLVVMTSVAGQPSRAVGRTIDGLLPAVPVSIEPWPGEGVWMEAVIPAEGGSWYGFYHNERVAVPCSGTKVTPRIGAARSTDYGATWTDLGVLLEAPPATYACETSNKYFVGGVGDLTAVRDAEARDIYIYFSEYARTPAQQGIGVARLPWADRDAPVGKAEIWSEGVWLPGRTWRRSRHTALISGLDSEQMRWALPAATPIFTTGNPWHDGDPAVDAFWGPSIHWNTYLQQYVMLLNRAKNETFAQEGVYVSFNPRLDDPAGWSTPSRLLSGGLWYPQVIGLDVDGGSDAVAGQAARFFQGGRSNAFIRFEK